MKKQVVLLLQCITMAALLPAQPCLYKDLVFPSQHEIDDFLKKYPRCTRIIGDVKISGVDIQDLSGLRLLTHIEGAFYICHNPLLTSLAGLDNIGKGSLSELHIYHNSILSECEVQSVLNYLALPSGTIEIHDNAPGCNSPDEIIFAYGQRQSEVRGSVSQGNTNAEVRKENTTFSYEVEQTGIVNLTLYDEQGKVVAILVNEQQDQGPHSIQWKEYGIASGIYSYTLSSSGRFKYGRLRVVK